MKVGQIRNGSRLENEGNLRLVMSSDLKDIELEMKECYYKNFFAYSVLRNE